MKRFAVSKKKYQKPQHSNFVKLETRLCLHLFKIESVNNYAKVRSSVTMTFHLYEVVSKHIVYCQGVAHQGGLVPGYP